MANSVFVGNGHRNAKKSYRRLPVSGVILLMLVGLHWSVNSDASLLGAPLSDSHCEARTGSRLQEGWIREVFHEVKWAPDPATTLFERIQGRVQSGFQSTPLVLEMLRLTESDPALRDTVTQVAQVIRECEHLGSPMNLQASSYNLGVKLAYFEVRMKSMMEVTVPGFFYGSSPLLEEESLQRGRVLLARIQAEREAQRDRTGSVSGLLKRTRRVRELGAEYITFEENDFQHALLVKHPDQVAQEVETERAVADWVKDTSFDAIGWYVKFQTRLLGPGASKVASTTVEASLCAAEKSYVRWRMSGGRDEPSLDQTAEDLKQCVVEQSGMAGLLEHSGQSGIGGAHSNATSIAVDSSSGPDEESMRSCPMEEYDLSNVLDPVGSWIR